MAEARLHRLTPGYGPDGTAPWDWVRDVRRWTPKRDAPLVRTGRKAARWRPFTVRVIREERTGDHFWLAGGHPVVTARAWAALESVVGRGVEPLPLKVEGGGELVLLNVLEFVPLGRGAEGPVNRITKVMSCVTRYAFREADAAGKVIFRVEGFAFGDCLVSEEFKEAVESANLLGFGFEPLDWIRES